MTRQALQLRPKFKKKPIFEDKLGIIDGTIKTSQN